MGGSNPISGLTSLVRGTGRAIKENPEKALLAASVGPVAGGLFLANEGIENEQKQARIRQGRAVGSSNAAAARAAEDQLIAEESVRAQKEKARKQTVFGGATGANLFNKSLIGASTTAAGGNQKAMLGG